MLSNLQTRDGETLVHPYTNLATLRDTGPQIIERGKGVWIYDGAGRPFLEGMAGLWCTALGWGNEELVEAAAAQMRKLSFQHVFGGKSHDPAIELGEALKELAPVPISQVFFTCSGSEANDSQVKLVWYLNNALGRPRKKKIIARHKGYHGVTVASASLTGLPANHQDFDLPIANIRHAACPHHYRFAEAGESEAAFSQRLAAQLEAQILAEDPDTVAAFIAEPVMGAGGVIVPPAGYWDAITPVLERYDVLLIADEVITGFGRLGAMFGSPVVGMRPQTISVAKALSSAYVPIGAVLIPQMMSEALVEQSRKLGTFAHGFTYSGHPVGAAVALKTLEIYRRDDIAGHVRRVMPRFAARLAGLADHPLVGEARGLGLMGAVEIVADKGSKRSFPPERGAAARCVALCLEEGLILRNLGESIAMCPPLIIGEDEIDTLFDRLGRALDRLEGEAARGGWRG